MVALNSTTRVEKSTVCGDTEKGAVRAHDRLRAFPSRAVTRYPNGSSGVKLGLLFSQGQVSTRNFVACVAPVFGRAFTPAEKLFVTGVA